MSIAELTGILGNIGEFVGAIAVVVTLLYLSIQVRQNTQATRASMDHAIRTDFNRLHELAMLHPQVAELMKDLGETSENVQAKSFSNWLLNRYVAVDTAFESGILPANERSAWTADFERCLKMWPRVKPLLEEQLRHYPADTASKKILAPLQDGDPVDT